MEFTYNLHNKNLLVKLKKSKRTRHVYLRVLTKDVIQISSHFYFSKNDALELLKSKEIWLKNNLEKMENNSLKDDEFLFLGEKRIKTQSFDIDEFYKDQIQKLLPPILNEYSLKMNVKPNKIKYRKNKNTWGSCSYKNDLNFNYLLMKFPLEVMEYIVIHELAHIKHKNHSKDFWLFVEEFCPDYKKREKLLKSFL